MTVLEVNALSHRYGNATVVEMPAWSVAAGEPWLSNYVRGVIAGRQAAGAEDDEETHTVTCH
jgi:hypothetical protein